MKIVHYDDISIHLSLGGGIHPYILLLYIFLIIISFLCFCYSFFIIQEHSWFYLSIIIVIIPLATISYANSFKEDIILNKETNLIFYQSSILGIMLYKTQISAGKIKSIDIKCVKTIGGGSRCEEIKYYKLCLNFENQENYTFPVENYLTIYEAHELSGMLKSFFVE